MPTHAGFFVGSGCTHHAHGGRVRWRWSCGGLHGDGLAVPGMRAARDMGSTGLLDALFPCAQLFFQPCGTFRIHVSRGLVVLRGNGVLEHRHAGFLQVGPGATDIARLGKACAKDFAEKHRSSSFDAFTAKAKHPQEDGTSIAQACQTALSPGATRPRRRFTYPGQAMPSHPRSPLAHGLCKTAAAENTKPFPPSAPDHVPSPPMAHPPPGLPSCGNGMEIGRASCRERV